VGLGTVKMIYAVKQVPPKQGRRADAAAAQAFRNQRGSTSFKKNEVKSAVAKI
jgi:hypothetical protein